MTLRRIACVDVPDLPLQLLLRAHPAYRAAPAAVVAETRPEAPLLLINRHARALRLTTGMRFGAAKSLVPELCAGAVPDVQVEEEALGLVRTLQTFSPHVERDPVSAGVFYLDPSGLGHLYGDEEDWARCVVRALRGQGFLASLVVAFGRSLSYALVRQTRGVRVLASVEETLEKAHEVVLARLHMPPKLRDALARLGLTTLGDLRQLGADQLSLRFGREAARWCAVARGEEVLPLCPEPHVDVPRTEVEIDPPDSDVARLCFAIKRGLDTLTVEVRKRGGSVRALWLRLIFERGGESAQRLEPSEATCNAPLLLELLRLRLSTLSLSDAVARVVLEAEPSALLAGQLAMFGPKRDVAAGERALARLRASYGDDAVCRAVMEDAHLPEAKYRWAPVVHLALPDRTLHEDAFALHAARTLVRRVLVKPEPLAGSLIDAEGGSPTLLHDGEPLALSGPYRVSGGWWVREIARDYYYARTAAGALLWVFFDRPRGGWFLHAWVD
jgi:protein ImuB